MTYINTVLTFIHYTKMKTQYTYILNEQVRENRERKSSLDFKKKIGLAEVFGEVDRCILHCGISG